MTVSFVRQLGAESGVQLNPLRDNSEIPAGDNSDQVGEGPGPEGSAQLERDINEFLDGKADSASSNGTDV